MHYIKVKVISMHRFRIIIQAHKYVCVCVCVTWDKCVSMRVFEFVFGYEGAGCCLIDAV